MIDKWLDAMHREEIWRRDGEGEGGGHEISTDGEKVSSLGAEGPRWERAEKRKGATASLFPRCKRWANS